MKVIKIEGNRDKVRINERIGGNEGILKEKGIEEEIGGKIEKDRRNIKFLKRVKEGWEIVILRKEGENDVIEKLMGDEEWRRYDVGKDGDDKERKVNEEDENIIEMEIRRIEKIILRKEEMKKKEEGEKKEELMMIGERKLRGEIDGRKR